MILFLYPIFGSVENGKRRKFAQKTTKESNFLFAWLCAENGGEEKIHKKLQRGSHVSIFRPNMREKHTVNRRREGWKIIYIYIYIYIYII